MVDAGASVKHTNEFLETLKEAGLPSPDYCVLTHWHWDHSFGAEALNLPLIAHRKTAEALTVQSNYSFSNKALDKRVAKGLEIAFCRDYMKLEMTEAERLNLQIRLPDIVFEDSLSINLGNVTCELEHVAGDHADDSVVVYIPDDKTLFLGDATYQCLYSELPYYSAEGTLALIRKLSRYDVRHALESHTDELYTHESFGHYLNMLASLANLVQDNSNEETLKRAVKKQFPDLAQEDIEEYSLMFLNGLTSKPIFE